MHTAFSATGIIMGAVSNKGVVIPTHLFARGLKVTADDYKDVLTRVVKLG